jgi:hypothetical protein
MFESINQYIPNVLEKRLNCFYFFIYRHLPTPTYSGIWALHHLGVAAHYTVHTKWKV